MHDRTFVFLRLIGVPWRQAMMLPLCISLAGIVAAWALAFTGAWLGSELIAQGITAMLASGSNVPPDTGTGPLLLPALALLGVLVFGSLVMHVLIGRRYVRYGADRLIRSL